MTRYMDSLASSLQDFLAKNVEQTDEVCESHQTMMVKMKDGNPFCVSCVREKVEREDRERAEKAAELAKKMNTYYWLRDRSLIADKTILTATFDSYETNDQETRENKAQAQKIADRYKQGEVFNTVLSGKQGTGKTHLAHAIATEVNEAGGKRCVFLSVDELFRQLKTGFSSKNYYQSEAYFVDELIREADLVVLDDLGSETGSIDTASKATEYVTKVLYSVANARQGKRTIVTTNLTSQELVMIYDRRLVSRLLANGKGNIIVFEKTTDKRMNFGF